MEKNHIESKKDYHNVRWWQFHKNIFMLPHWLHKHHWCVILKRTILNFKNIHLPKTSPYCNGFGHGTFFVYFLNANQLCGCCSSPNTNLQVLTQLWWFHFAPNTKPTLSLSHELTSNLCCLCIFLNVWRPRMPLPFLSTLSYNGS
jgi:hypothetical protein